MIGGISISALLGNIFLFLFGCGPFHNCHRRNLPATMYLFKLLISASLKRHFHVLSYAGKDKKINHPNSTVAGFVFILVLMFALQYLIKL
jgi:hypothetical protein